MSFKTQKARKPSRMQLALQTRSFAKMTRYAKGMAANIAQYATAKAALAADLGKAALVIHRTRKQLLPEQVEAMKRDFNALVMEGVAKARRRSYSSQLSQLWGPALRNKDVALLWAKNGNNALRQRKVAKVRSTKATRGQLKQQVKQQARVILAYAKLCTGLASALDALRTNPFIAGK